MEFTGHEKPLEQYSKSELMRIAKRYTVYHKDNVRGKFSADYDKLSKSQLIKYIKDDTDYVVSKSNSRVEFVYGVGGSDKMNSSSWLLHEYFERQRKLLGI